MYQQLYQLVANPFRLAPEPDFCFGHTDFRRAREYLEYALNQGEGFVMVTGRSGTGKTMLVETFLKDTDVSRTVARRIAVANYGAEDLLRAVAYAYGIDAEGLDKGTMRYRIQQYFIEQERSGRRLLLIIDEAQALQHTALEELRILADLQTQSRIMLQLFLVGQESLQELMRTPDMEQFQQRVIANYHLTPLNLLDTRNYIEHRLLHAGWNGDPEFTSAAVVAIYKLSKGMPRHINKICSRLLLLGYSKGSHVFNEADVREISAEMHQEQLAPLDVGTSMHADSKNVTDLSEIRDDVISGTDLAIRVDKIDAKAAGIHGRVSLAAQHKAEFEARHRYEQDDAIQPNARPGQPYIADIPDHHVLEPVQVSCEPVFAQHRTQQRGATPAPDRIPWKKTAVIIAGVFASATILLAAMPSILEKVDVDVLLAMLTPDTQVVQNHSSDHLVSTTEPVRGEPQSEAVTDSPDSAPTETVDSEDLAHMAEIDVAYVLPVAEPINKNVSDDQGIGSFANTEMQRPVPVFVASTDELMNDRDDQILSETPEVTMQPATDRSDRDTAVISPFRNDDLDMLLANGQLALDDYRLMTPEQDNAYYYLHAALQIDSDNAIAQAAIQRIVDIYIILAGKEADKDEFARAGRYLDRGLEIQPNNAAMLALQERVNARLVESGAEPVARRTARSVPDDSIKLNQNQNPPQLLNAPVLKKRQSAARRRQVSYTIE